MGRIYLVGLPGVGKSTLGALLAKNVSWGFLDLDEGLKKRMGLTIPEMFERYGEPRFRNLESEYLFSLGNMEGELVIATGGGIVLKEENRRFMNETGIVVYLERSPESILRGIDVTQRPLLVKNPQILFDLERQRRELYLDCCSMHLILHGDVDESLEILHQSLLIGAMQV